MQRHIPCSQCHGTGRTDAVDEFGQFDSCDTCEGEGALVRCSCGATVTLRDAGSDGRCAQCPETVARRAAIAAFDGRNMADWYADKVARS